MTLSFLRASLSVRDLSTNTSANSGNRVQYLDPRAHFPAFECSVTIHHGYFIPRPTPDGVGVSFPGLGQDGPADVAVAMFTFPDEESYRRYREMVASDPECQSASALVRETSCFIHYERLFLQPVLGA
jgi:hypothetical protein